MAVIGSGSKLGPAHAALAEELGAALVQAGFGIVTGGLGGVMEAVSRGARSARGLARHPPIVGILPGYDVADGNEHLDLVLPTGFGHARNALVVAAGEAVVCLAGATGALSEVALARKMGRPVIALTSTGGTARLSARAIKAVVAATSPREAVARVQEALGA